LKPDSAALSSRARAAAQAKDWRAVQACAVELLQRNPAEPEGHFLTGLAARSNGRPLEAAAAFERALGLDAIRYDAAVELASIYQSLGRNAEAAKLLEAYAGRLRNSPMYLDLAGAVYSRLGLHERAGPLHELANRLQPGVGTLQANLAACLVYLGRIDEAISLYEELLRRVPNHQRHHYQLANLRRARDDTHVEQMKAVLRATGLPPARNIFLYYAIGKELEDLERWDEAFHYYRLAGDAVCGVAGYDVRSDLALIDQIIGTCTADWLADGPGDLPTDPAAAIPIFIVGLPRTGTTLAERILSSHSRVESAGETLFMPGALQRHSEAESSGVMTAAVITAATRRHIGQIGQAYLDDIAYRLAGKPLFIDKFPENFLYLGFIAKAFPHARIVHLRRHPMDTCFALYKQSFFRYAYSLDDLGRYYVAHERLRQHWLAVLGDRLIELSYEELVADQEGQTRRLLDAVGLAFEPACLEFERNPTASATASAAQVREGIHARSVGKWKRFASHLGGLREYLTAEGVDIDAS
jgi:tetratricopeptide (TPR) repeat protein